MPHAVTRQRPRALVLVRDPVERALVTWLLAHDQRFASAVACGEIETLADLASESDVVVVDLASAALDSGGPLAGVTGGRPEDGPVVVVMAHVDAPYLKAAVAREGAVWVRPASSEDLCDAVAAAAATARRDLRPWCP